MNLNQITIYSNKPTETVEFHRQLGLQLIVDSMPRYARTCNVPTATQRFRSRYGRRFFFFNIALYFECEGLDAQVTKLKI